MSSFCANPDRSLVSKMLFSGTSADIGPFCWLVLAGFQSFRLLTALNVFRLMRQGFDVNHVSMHDIGSDPNE